MHVQSISHWAPANIGPYSQAVKVMERRGQPLGRDNADYALSINT